jgi:hypothetical protein
MSRYSTQSTMQCVGRRLRPTVSRNARCDSLVRLRAGSWRPRLQHDLSPLALRGLSALSSSGPLRDRDRPVHCFSSKVANLPPVCPCRIALATLSKRMSAKPPHEPVCDAHILQRFFASLAAIQGEGEERPAFVSMAEQSASSGCAQTDLTPSVNDAIGDTDGDVNEVASHSDDDGGLTEVRGAFSTASRDVPRHPSVHQSATPAFYDQHQVLERHTMRGGGCALLFTGLAGTGLNGNSLLGAECSYEVVLPTEAGCALLVPCFANARALQLRPTEVSKQPNRCLSCLCFVPSFTAWSLYRHTTARPPRPPARRSSRPRTSTQTLCTTRRSESNRSFVFAVGSETPSSVVRSAGFSVFAPSERRYNADVPHAHSRTNTHTNTLTRSLTHTHSLTH